MLSPTTLLGANFKWPTIEPGELASFTLLMVFAMLSIFESLSPREKLPTKQGAGLTAKGRAKYNKETGSNLKAPAPNPKTPKDESRKKSFCSRMSGVAKKATNKERAIASLRRWNCPGV